MIICQYIFIKNINEMYLFICRCHANRKTLAALWHSYRQKIIVSGYWFFRRHVLLYWGKPVWWNWQTWRTQNPLVATPCGFDPRHRHHVKNLFCLLDKRGFLQWYPFLSERVIYLRYDIALRAMIYACGIWRNGYYITFAEQIYHAAKPYIISRQRYIIEIQLLNELKAEPE